jgi:hypothetical protein
VPNTNSPYPLPVQSFRLWAPHSVEEPVGVPKFGVWYPPVIDLRRVVCRFTPARSLFMLVSWLKLNIFSEVVHLNLYYLSTVISSICTYASFIFFIFLSCCELLLVLMVLEVMNNGGFSDKDTNIEANIKFLLARFKHLQMSHISGT